MKESPCPVCGSTYLFRSKEVSAGGGYAPDYLPELHGFWVPAQFRLVLCKDCGLTRFFASKEAREKVSESKKWERI